MSNSTTNSCSILTDVNQRSRFFPVDGLPLSGDLLGDLLLDVLVLLEGEDELVALVPRVVAVLVLLVLPVVVVVVVVVLQR